MHELYELKEKLIDELAEYGTKEMSAGTLDVVDKLAHAVKNLCKIIEEAEYSEAGESYEGGSYAQGGGGRGGGGGGSSRAMRGGSYTMARGRGRSSRRNSMGSYASDDGLVEELRGLLEEAPDQRTKMELEKFIRKMEQM